MKTITIGQLAKRASVGIETVRFYEREGLLEEPERRASGYREYHEDVVRRLLFIRRGKELGFSLKEIKQLLALRVDGRARCSAVEKRAEAKLSDIEEKIRQLQRIRRTLRKLTEACRNREATSDCPILDALEA